jgi:putative transposase
MSHYRRAIQPGGTFFFTAVAFDRRPVLDRPRARSLLREAIRAAKAARPFEVVAFVLLPDHLHTLWQLPPDNGDFSTRWRQIKARFTHDLIRDGRSAEPVSPSRRRTGERDVWQRRFWEHVIRDEEDLRRHLDYIHWNPVKHGLVTRVRDWPWSTFHRYVRQGIYSADWGASEPVTIADLHVAEE